MSCYRSLVVAITGCDPGSDMVAGQAQKACAESGHYNAL
jgi:hypothetical protein